MLNKLIMFGSIAAALAGCQTATSKGIGMPGTDAWRLTASPKVQAAHYQGICRKYGFRPRTAQMAHCVALEKREDKRKNQKIWDDLEAENRARQERHIREMDRINNDFNNRNRLPPV